MFNAISKKIPMEFFWEVSQWLVRSSGGMNRPRKALKIIKSSNAISNNKMNYRTIIMKKSTDVRMDRR